MCKGLRHDAEAEEGRIKPRRSKNEACGWREWMSQRQNMRRILDIDAARWSRCDATAGDRGISECAPCKRTDEVAAGGEAEAAVDAAGIVIGSGGC